MPALQLALYRMAQELAQLPATPCDVVVLDLHMPGLGGLATTQRLRAEYPEVRVLVLSMVDHERSIGQVLTAGAAGYVLKNADHDEILVAVRAVAAGRRFLCSELDLSMLEKVLTDFLASFAPLPDPRCAGRTRHSFLNLLVIAVCAVVAGAETWVDIDPYGRMKHAWLSTFLALPHGIPFPSHDTFHDTFRRVFSLVDPSCLAECFRQWMATVAPPLLREVVGIDGKTVRRSDRGREQGPLHVVRAFATQQGLSLGQVAVSGKGQELATIPLLISSLCLTTTIVTLDALGAAPSVGAAAERGIGSVAGLARPAIDYRGRNDSPSAASARHPCRAALLVDQLFGCANRTPRGSAPPLGQ